MLIYLIFKINEIDAIDDELSSLVINTYTKTEVDNLLTNINLTGSENINITNNENSLAYPSKANNEPLLNPRVNVYFEIHAAPNGISFLQHNSDGSQPKAIFNSLDKSVELFRDLDIPFYNKNGTGYFITNRNLVNYYTKNQVDSLIYNINLVDCYTKTNIDTVLYTNYTSLTFLVANFHPKNEIDSTLIDYTTSAQLHDVFYSKVKTNLRNI